MKSERNVIILSHSQGNLFANVALQQLKSENPMFVPGNTSEGRFLGALHRGLVTFKWQLLPEKLN